MQIPTTSFVGKSKKIYVFTVHDIDYECPDESGVYVFCKKTELENNKTRYTPIYFGKAKHFDKRFYNHHKDDCVEGEKADCLCLLKETKEESRVKIENDLLGAYNTPCNEVNNS